MALRDLAAWGWVNHYHVGELISLVIIECGLRIAEYLFRNQKSEIENGFC